jgi:hypothetical protein
MAISRSYKQGASELESARDAVRRRAARAQPEFAGRVPADAGPLSLSLSFVFPHRIFLPVSTALIRLSALVHVAPLTYESLFAQCCSPVLAAS